MPIAALPDMVARLPKPARSRFESLLLVTSAHGDTVVPPQMESWVADRFGNVDAVRHQQVIRVRNRWTLDEALFNPLRSRRPVDRTVGDVESLIAERLARGDNFAHPEAATTADTFGRVEGRHAVSAANVAKIDGSHGVVIFHEPHPLRFGRDQVRDYLDVARRWFALAHQAVPQARYPLIIWNCLPRSGASIVHGHMQLLLAREQHYAQIERWRRTALAYSEANGLHGCSSYFADLLAAHTDLGLRCYDTAGIRAVASLTPARPREVLLVAGMLGDELADALAHTLRVLIDGQGVHAFNAAVALPPLGPTIEPWAGFPVLARVCDRGDPLSLSSDLGAVEVFASNVISVDPFDVAAGLNTYHRQ